MIGRLLILLVRLYQMTLSRCLPRNVCIYEPSCSHYMIGAIREHGVFKGVAMGACRILRCHPFAKGGWDPVPPRKDKRQPEDRDDGPGQQQEKANWTQNSNNA